MSQRSMRIWLAIWVAVTLFWFITTYRFHPTLLLAIIVTLSLMLCYAMVIFLDWFYLRKHLAIHRQRWRYLGELGSTMLVATAVALTIIRRSYFLTLGPDPDPWGFPKHFAIDLFGLFVHWIGAQIVKPLVNANID